MSIKNIRFRLIAVFAIVATITVIGLFLILWQTKMSNSVEKVAQEQVSVPEHDESSVKMKDAVPAIRWIAIGTTALVLMVIIMGTIWIIHYFNKSMRIPQFLLGELVQGNTKLNVPVVQNEFSPIVDAIVELSKNVQRSSDFAEKIGEGDFNYDFHSTGDHDTLGNALLQMRGKLKHIAEVDKARNWLSTGLALFADLIRKGGDQMTLSDSLINQLVKYTHSSQGGLYNLHQQDGHDSYLELTACYAYDRKKFHEKRIEIGNGLLGQCFLEGSTVHLTQVPNNYVSITSGLGMSNPTSILIVPLKLNDSIEGVVELASFSQYQKHEIEFVERVGEMIASAITTARISDQTKKMLEESQQQSEEMRAQEEEMRQNMEEMQATHEAMERQTNELKRMQESLEVEKSMFTALMDALPDRITYKDTNSRITRINKAKADRLNMRAEDVIGKTDYDFFAAEHAEKAMREEKELLDSGRPLLDIEELLTFNSGETAWVSSSRIPFRNDHNVTTGMFIISKDITKYKHTEIQLTEKKEILKNLFDEFPIIQFSVDKDRRIKAVITGKIRDPQSVSSALNGQFIQEVLPNVSKQLHNEITTAAPIVDTLSNGMDLKQFVFQDKIQTGSYTIIAIVV